MGFAFTHLAELVRGGMPLHEAFRIAGCDIEQKWVRKKFSTVSELLENGISLVDIPEFRGMLPDGMTALFGMTPGLPEIADALDSIAAMYNSEMKSQYSDKRLFLGPVSLFLCLLAFIAVMGGSVATAVHTFGKIFNSLGAILPVPTKICIFLGEWLFNYWYYLFFAVLIAGWSLFFLYGMQHRFRLAAAVIYRTPILGAFSKLKMTALLIQYIIIGIRLRLPMHQIIRGFSESCGNRVWKKKTMHLSDELAKGKSFSESAKSAKLPEPDLCLIMNRRETGSLDSGLNELRDSIIRDVDQRFRILVRRMQIIYLIGTAVIVGFFVIAMYMPMFALIGELTQ